MRPAPEIVLAAVVADIERSMAGMEPGPQVARMAIRFMLLDTISRDSGSAAQRGIENIAMLVRFLESGIEIVPPRDRTQLVSTVENARAGQGDLTLRGIDSTTNLLLSALIELQVMLEESSEPAALALRKEIWTFIAKENDREILKYRPF